MRAIIPNTTLRHLPHLTNKLQPLLTLKPPRHRRYSSLNAVVSSLENASEPSKINTITLPTNDNKSNNNKVIKGSRRLFPKRGEEVELVCESLAFKGKGLCKVEETGYVVMCDRALPGERFIGRVTRKKNNYSEVTKVKTLSPHNDMVEAPCEYASHCGGCRTQNLLYEAQVRAKEEQVRDLVVHVGKFSVKDPEFENVMKPIVPCDMQFHYRNKMEFSFGTKRWLPKEQLLDKSQDANVYSLGLHAPGFFDKVLNVDKCFLQSEPANKVLAAVQECWRDPELGLSPYDCHSHAGFFKHLMIRSGRDVETRLPQLMVNFVTSSYKPELLKPLVDKLTVFPEVVISLQTQLSNHKRVEERLRKIYGNTEAKNTLSKAVYLFSIGTNDYISPYLITNSTRFNSTYSNSQLVQIVIGNLTTAIKELHKRGGRKFGFLSLGPLGCLPGIRIILNPSSDSGGCIEAASLLAKLHNQALAKSLKRLAKQLHGFKYSLYDFNTNLNQRLKHPSKYGYKQGKKACCGTGRFRGTFSCGGKRPVKEFQVCKNPKEYVFWDSYHLTERVHKQMAYQMWNQQPTKGTYNLKTLFQLQ